ncbi:phage major capsid protein, P2 family [Ignatzschineria rhizosphaerae]|uniref:Phage major capsid protein, P2 family n=1 Tax=Ignatzschineria rhizosphaerae TaxID=2923279 RepID=A0ABY3WY05_9GAMM|nr:P2 family phage major capsid protein [Ignatzschineria rhizosphaerae]UNM95499.1 phage major capsid protein, P2 family [Ignatzschineria rhizosphaerae]
MRVLLNSTAESGISAFFKSQAEHNNVSFEFVAEGNAFSVIPSVEHRWITGLQDASPFLKRITMSTCDEMIVNDLNYEAGGIVSGRTDTTKNDRKTKEMGTVKGVKYECVVIDHDTHIKFSDLNRWSTTDRNKFLDRINDRRRTSKMNDIVMIGWHGIKAADETDPTKNPLGEDVAIGWLQHVRTNKPTNVLKDAITIGKNGDYANLDALVIGLKAQIPMYKRKDLVVLASSDLVDARSMGLAETADVSETAGKKVGLAATYLSNGDEVLTPDYFPEKTVIVTNLANLHHLTKKGSTNIHPNVNSARSQLELFNQALETYAIGDYEQIIIAENVTVAVPLDEANGGE